ncbi:hypothetical protein [Paenibacillus sinopodophylli]|uniref:hypothetical protein n=1 Tax=Paenibacillus sinopodophylli TaxID=1837342 RepID=UPI00110C9B40|nr:hypothetical protein [Paenibacillus sinopodophylli]
MRYLLGYPQKDLRCFTVDELKNNIEVFLHTYLLSCILSKDEYTLWNKNGMRDDMPKEFYDSTSAKFYRNPWARYLAQNLNNIILPEVEVYHVEWEKKKVGRQMVWAANPVRSINLYEEIHCYLDKIPVSLSWQR